MSHSVVYICSHCDAQYPKWSGRCTECGKWGTLKESDRPVSAPAGLGMVTAAATPAKVATLSDFAEQSIKRITASGFPAGRMFPRGLALGSITLVTGEPGAGKSTLCLQLALNFSAAASVLYITSEESAIQVKERAERLGSFGKGFAIAESTALEEIIATISVHRPQIVVIDSLQTVVSGATSGDAGSINQIRLIAAALAQLAKQEQIAVILIGHVTKDGSLAGPKTLEHIVDAVYYLEADRNSAYRLLRSYKNRYGETGKVVVMHVGRAGLSEVENAATIFIQNFTPKPGSVLTMTEIDDQFFFVEVQALVTSSSFGYAKRTASGFSRSRLELLLAIMKKHMHVDCDQYDVYINIAGGFKIHEPAMDAAVVMAILSSLKDTALPAGTVVFGEVGLSGELRVVKDTAERLKEIEKHKYSRVFLPPLAKNVSSKVELIATASIQEVVKHLKW